MGNISKYNLIRIEITEYIMEYKELLDNSNKGDKMKDTRDLIVLVIGIICFTISVITLFPLSALMGVILIILGLSGIPHYKSDREQKEED